MKKTLLIRTIPNPIGVEKVTLRDFAVSDHSRYMPHMEVAAEEVSDDTEDNAVNVEQSDTSSIQYETAEESQQTAESKKQSQSKQIVSKWIREWDFKKYNLIFAEVFGLYFLIMSAIFVSDYYSLPLYIIVTFAIPYVIYFAIKHFVEYKKSKLNNNEE